MLFSTFSRYIAGIHLITSILLFFFFALITKPDQCYFVVIFIKGNCVGLNNDVS